jgi:hypothetical protein
MQLVKADQEQRCAGRHQLGECVHVSDGVGTQLTRHSVIRSGSGGSLFVTSWISSSADCNTSHELSRESIWVAWKMTLTTVCESEDGPQRLSSVCSACTLGMSGAAQVT